MNAGETASIWVPQGADTGLPFPRRLHVGETALPMVSKDQPDLPFPRRHPVGEAARAVLPQSHDALAAIPDARTQ